MSTDLTLLIRAAASLLAVLLLIVVAARFARRAGGQRGGDTLRVLDRVGLARDAAAVVVESGGRRLLLGVASGRVTLLTDLGPATTDAATREIPDDGQDIPSAPAVSSTPVSPATPTVSSAVSAIPRQGAAHRAEHGKASEPDRTAEPAAERTAGAGTVRVTAPPATRRAVREMNRRRRIAVPPTQRGSGSVLDPRTWHQGLEALRDLTARRG
jgi:flagellar biogenesis protein FliO